MSTLLITTASADLNSAGYLSGLSSPSVTESSASRSLSPRSKAVGHTRLPTFSISSSSMPAVSS